MELLIRLSPSEEECHSGRTGSAAAVPVKRMIIADDVVVATTNVGHLSRFLDARRWTDIQAPVEE